MTHGPNLLAALRLLGWLATAALFGGVLAVVKGDGSGWRFVLGNLSAPYVLPPFALGTRYCPRNRVIGAAIGSAAVAAELVGFYSWEAISFGLITRQSISHEVVVGVLGLGLGAVYGIIGSQYGRKRSVLVALALSAPFWLDSTVQILPGHIGNLRGDPASLRDYPYIFAVEAVAGAAILLVLSFARSRGDKTASPE